MPDLFPFDIDTIQAFLLALTRVTATIVFLPITGGRASPNLVKIGLATLMTVIMFPMIDTGPVTVQVDALTMGLKVASEAMIGITTAYFVILVFTGVQLAGSVIGFQVGFGIVNVVDPVTSAQVSLTSQFFNIVTMLLFLTFNVHLVLLSGLAGSFGIIPLGGFVADRGLFDVLIDAMRAVYITGAQVAGPLTVMLLLKQVAMGLIARTIPQINIFIVGFPLTIALGLLSMSIAMPALSGYVEKLFARMTSRIELVYYLMG